MEEKGIQNLVLLEKSRDGLQSKVICQVLYVPLRGRYQSGASLSPEERTAPAEPAEKKERNHDD